MSFALNLIVILALVAALVVAMVLVARRAPEGGLFSDSGRAGGVFAVAGTAFAVLLAFLIVVAFQSYNTAKSSAGREATAIEALFATSRLFPDPARERLQRALVCYANSVIDDEWPAMEHEERSQATSLALVRLEDAVGGLPAPTLKSDSGYALAQQEMDIRAEGRDGRLSEASPSIPPLLWAALLIGALSVIAFTFGFASSTDRVLVPILLMGTIAAIVVSGLFVVRFLDHPYQEGSNDAISPVAMENARDAMLIARDEVGRPRVTCPRVRPRASS